MILLVTKAEVTLSKYESPYLGRLVQPRHYSNMPHTIETGRAWAADNDCFQGLDADRYTKMIDHLAQFPSPKFVTLPDVVGDADRTFELVEQWLPKLRERGLPVGFVLQDGADDDTVPWADMDALFVGGTTEYKLSEEAAAFVRAAKRRSLWVHMGRVNSRKRIRYAHSLGCDSVDGSAFSMFSDTHIPWAVDLLAELDSYEQLSFPM